MKWTEEQKKRLRVIRQAFWDSKGAEYRMQRGDQISKAKMGHGWPEGYHQNQSEAQKKRFETDKVWNRGLIYGQARWFWKDNPNEYRNLHKRINRMFGSPTKCEDCGTTTAKRFEWANVSGEYLENRSDWRRVCKYCHDKIDQPNQKGIALLK